MFYPSECVNIVVFSDVFNLLYDCNFKTMLQGPIRSGGGEGGGEMGPGPSKEAGHIEDRGPGPLCLSH